MLGRRVAEVVRLLRASAGRLESEREPLGLQGAKTHVFADVAMLGQRVAEVVRLLRASVGSLESERGNS
jgi:hypothetical protein